MINGTYVSGDACERDDAFQLGYRNICQHPREVGVPVPGEVLVIGLDGVLFHEQGLAVEKASEATNRGVPVGIHTYYPDDPRLSRFLALPNVAVARTHRLVLALLGRQARIPGLPPSMSEESSDVREAA